MSDQNNHYLSQNGTLNGGGCVLKTLYYQFNLLVSKEFLYFTAIFRYCLSNTNHHTALTDAELAAQYRHSGNQQLLSIIYNRYAHLLFGVSMQYLKDADAAADACSDIYIELVDKMKRHEVQNVKAWLHTLTRNHCLMKLRSGKKMPTSEFPDYFMQSEDMWHPEEAVSKEKQLTTMEKCIEQLKTEQQQAVKLFYLEEKCYNEIAEITGLAWNNIRSQIQNGRRNLKICMEENEQRTA